MNVVRYASWMKERGWKVFVFGVNGSRIQEEAIANSLEFIPVRRNGKHFDLVNAYRVSKLLKRHSIKLVWYRDNRDLSMLAWTKWIPGTSFKLLYQQAMQFGVSKKDIVHTIRFRHVNAWVSTLMFLANQVKKMTNYPHKRISVIPLGSELKTDSSISKTEAREFYHLPHDAFVFGILGRIDPLKGQDLLIRALAETDKMGKNVHVLIVGESTLHEGNEYEDLLRKLVVKYGLSDRVHFYGYTKETQRFYSAIDVFVMASKGETFGMVTIEAMSQGKPVIGSNSSGTPELLQNEQAGWLFEPENYLDLRERMIQVCQSPDEVETKGINAQKVYRYFYSKEASLHGFDLLLTSLGKS
jgi:glycosyltransferase involved in cell wall biosynthesis